MTLLFKSQTCEGDNKWRLETENSFVSKQKHRNFSGFRLGVWNVECLQEKNRNLKIGSTEADSEILDIHVPVSRWCNPLRTPPSRNLPEAASPGTPRLTSRWWRHRREGKQTRVRRRCFRLRVSISLCRELRLTSSEKNDNGLNIYTYKWLLGLNFHFWFTTLHVHALRYLIIVERTCIHCA